MIYLDKVGHSCYSKKKNIHTNNVDSFFTFKYSNHHLINVFYDRDLIVCKNLQLYILTSNVIYT